MAQTTNIQAVPLRTPFFQAPEPGDFNSRGTQRWSLSRAWILFFEKLVPPTNPLLSGSGVAHASARMTSVGTLTIPNNGNRIALTFDTKDSDTGDFWNASANTRFTAPAAGDYYVFYAAPSQAIAQPSFGVSAFASGAGVTSGSLGINPTYFQIRKNGNNSSVYAGNYAEGYFWTAAGGSTFTDIGPHANGEAIISLAAGDYLELVAWQNYTGGPTSAYTYPPSITASQQPIFGIMGPLGGNSSGILLETNGSQNPSQLLLNLIAGPNIVLSPDSKGGVTVSGLGSSGYVGYGSEFPITDPTLTAFTWRNQGSATVASRTRSLFLTAPAVAGTNVRGREISAPAPPVSITICLVPQLHAQNFNQCGLYVTDGTKLIEMAVGVGTFLIVQSLATVTSSGSALSNPGRVPGSPVFLKVVDDGVNLSWYWSTNGVDFFQVYSAGRTAYLSSIAAIGFFADSENASWPCGINLLSWAQGTS